MLSCRLKLIKVILATILGILVTQNSAFADRRPLPREQDLTKIERLIINNSNFPARTKVIFPGILIEGNYAVAEWQTETMAGTMYLQKQANQWKIIGGGFADINYLKAIGMPSKEAKILLDYINPQFESETICKKCW